MFHVRSSTFRRMTVRQTRSFSNKTDTTDSNSQFPVKLGMVCLAFLGYRHAKDRHSQHHTEPDVSTMASAESLYKPLPPWKVAAFAVLPFRWMSQVWGSVTSVEIPNRWIRSKVYEAWCNAFNVDRADLDRDLGDFRSLAEFFTRPLKEGSRQINQNKGVVVSPVDAVVVSKGSFRLTEEEVFETYTKHNLDHVKGVTYTFKEFLGPFPFGVDRSKPLKFSYVVLYLAPGDYHRFHSPVEWDVVQRRHFPGSLVPLRAQFAGMFERNERVVLNGTWENGFFSMAAVGALNVGSIELECEKSLTTNKSDLVFNRQPNIDCYERVYATPFSAVRGQHMGQFNLGSTIVLVFQEGNAQLCVSPHQRVKVGECIARPMRSYTTSPRVVLSPPWPKSQPH